MDGMRSTEPTSESSGDVCDVMGSRGSKEEARVEIRRLWDLVAADRVNAGLSLEPDADALQRMADTPMVQVRKVCELPSDPKALCSDVCRLAEAICENAQSICRLANELGERWANDRCTGAKTSCAEASERCCGC